MTLWRGSFSGIDRKFKNANTVQNRSNYAREAEPVPLEPDLAHPSPMNEKDRSGDEVSDPLLASWSPANLNFDARAFQECR